MTDLTVSCDESRCSFEKTTTSYSRAQDLAESHHITTGHRPPITEEDGRNKTFEVVCDRHDVIDTTDFYERAKDIADNHHIVSGCRPIINEVE